MRRAALAAAFLAAMPVAAVAQTAPSVYTGCAVPSTTYVNSWTFDPVNGDDVAGDGSAAHPWKTIQSMATSGAWGGPRLATVLYYHSTPGVGWSWSGNASATIHPGDKILLASGNHGTLTINVYSKMVENGTGWITVTAAPGASPVLTGVSLTGTNNWRFTNLKFQDSQVSTDGGPPMILVNGAAAPATTHDIVFDNITVSSNDTLNFSATPIAFNTSVMAGAKFDDDPSASCVSLTKSRFYNLMFGVQGTSQKTLIDHNEIDHIGADGIDIDSGQVAVTNNFIHDMHASDPVTWHVDFIQGQGYAHTHLFQYRFY